MPHKCLDRISSDVPERERESVCVCVCVCVYVCIICTGCLCFAVSFIVGLRFLKILISMPSSPTLI